MIVTELRLINLVLVLFLFTTPSILIDAAAGRCYLCSQNTLAECAGSTQSDSPFFTTIMQYYTEPCNGQCVLFQNEKTSTIRGCSWTYGHMTPKSTGWHELSPGIQAYFCDSYLCNNGTIKRPEIPLIRTGIVHDEIIQIPLIRTTTTTTISPQQLFILSGNTLPNIQTDEELPPLNEMPRQLRQCYVCTARLTGCGEYLDPRFASRYIQPCASSCILFRNPNDHFLITRGCSTSWPQAHAKSGLHKLHGSDAFFCQESLCNGISFDFIMGIFHNQLPAVITFPPTEPIEETSTPAFSWMIPHTTTFTPSPSSTIVPIEDDNVIWEDPDLDFVLVEPTRSTIPIPSTSSPFLSTELPDDTEEEYESSSIPLDSVEHFEFVEEIPASSTISGGMAVAADDSSLNWWDISESSVPPLTEPINSLSTTTSSLSVFDSSTTASPSSPDEDDWAIFHTSSTPSLEHFSDINPDVDFDMNDIFLFSTLSTIPADEPNNNQTPSFIPQFFTDDQTKEQLFDLMKPVPTLVMPPFSWMLQLARQNQSELHSRENLAPQNSTTTTKKPKKKKRVDLANTADHHLDQFHEYCKKKQCQHGGRLNSDCMCICLPAFSGNNCERINCEREPAHLCDFVLEDECQNDRVRYLCPKFCQMKICSSKKSS